MTDDTLKAQAEDARMGHVRLDETRANPIKGPLYDRISWLIQILADENCVQLKLRQAEQARADILAKQVVVAESERSASFCQQRATEAENAALLARLHAVEQERDKAVLDRDGFQRYIDVIEGEEAAQKPWRFCPWCGVQVAFHDGDPQMNCGVGGTTAP